MLQFVNREKLTVYVSTWKLCCLEAEDEKERDNDRTDVETLHKADKRNAADELADKFQLSTYGQR